MTFSPPRRPPPPAAAAAAECRDQRLRHSVVGQHEAEYTQGAPGFVLVRSPELELELESDRDASDESDNAKKTPGVDVARRDRASCAPAAASSSAAAAALLQLPSDLRNEDYRKLSKIIMLRRTAIFKFKLSPRFSLLLPADRAQREQPIGGLKNSCVRAFARRGALEFK